MKDLPEIAPEIRGLLEEIVADPRSAIRFAPRRALRSWFESAETVRARDVSATKAGRHLIEAHREALAALLCEAAWIAYWKAPLFAHRPIGSDGQPFDPSDREPTWRLRAELKLSACREESEGIRVLRQCSSGIRPELGLSFARASLSLVPHDRTRLYVALTIPWGNPRTALNLLHRLAARAHISYRPDALLLLAARMCSISRLPEARELYRRYSNLVPESPYGHICAFNLSCYVGDEAGALAEATQLDELIRPDDPRVSEERRLLSDWAATRSESELSKAKEVRAAISGRMPEVAAVLCQSFES